jgi:hypothetical protein
MRQPHRVPIASDRPGKPSDPDDRRDDDEAPTTPTDEPAPVPVQDPPSDERPRPPLTVVPMTMSSARHLGCSESRQSQSDAMIEETVFSIDETRFPINVSGTAIAMGGRPEVGGFPASAAWHRACSF